MVRPDRSVSIVPAMVPARRSSAVTVSRRRPMARVWAVVAERPLLVVWALLVVVFLVATRVLQPASTRSFLLALVLQVPLVALLVRPAWLARPGQGARGERGFGRLDPLSGVLNRRAVTDDLERLVSSGAGALIVVDVDRFRDLNQYLGLEQADEVLCRLVAVLRDEVGRTGTVGRLAGDEFAVLLPGTATPVAMELAQRIGARAAQPMRVGEHHVNLTVSAGVASWGRGECPGPSTVLSHAYEALRNARRNQRGVERFDAERDSLAVRRLALVDPLRRSVRDESVVLHYQPQVDLCTGEVIGVEALARWRHEGEAIPPDVFIALAEESGLITELTYGLLEQALRQLAVWDRAGWQLTMSVNLSPCSLLDPALGVRVAEALQRHGLAPGRLVLEITETTSIPAGRVAQEAIEGLHAQGIRLSIDDYGTGHAALNYLRDFAVDELKLDRTYVAPVAEDARTQAIVAATVAMGRRLGLTVIAEGVETHAQAHALIACGATVAQGYLVSPPLPAAELASWLANRPRQAQAFSSG